VLIAEKRKDISTEYGLVSTQSIGAIQRALLRLEQEGGDVLRRAGAGTEST
jgi:hypothetical protein